jgi:1-aminocyclopropane-1-carboxylate deaminase/D-cysteine desulfhydrase-like pyridoxal-dependent ACC family enzyme
MVPPNKTGEQPQEGVQKVKRTLIALMAGVMTFGAAYGLAAGLNLTSDTLGAGDTVVAACQSGTLTATYSSSYSSSLPGYEVGTVTVTGMAASCHSKAYKVTLYGSGNASLGEATGTTPASGSSFAATFASPVSAAALTGLSVVISG